MFDLIKYWWFACLFVYSVCFCVYLFLSSFTEQIKYKNSVLCAYSSFTFICSFIVCFSLPFDCRWNYEFHKWKTLAKPKSRLTRHYRSRVRLVNATYIRKWYLSIHRDLIKVHKYCTITLFTNIKIVVYVKKKNYEYNRNCLDNPHAQELDKITLLILIISEKSKLKRSYVY